jgi:hypothetical protein
MAVTSLFAPNVNQLQLLCVNNMATIAHTEFMCADSDLACFCGQSNWAYGIRDCAQQACDAQQAGSAISWANARCAGVAATATGTPAALPILSSAAASVGSATGIVTSVITSVVSQASSAASSAASGAESITSSLASVASSAAESASSATDSAA